MVLFRGAVNMNTCAGIGLFWSTHLGFSAGAAPQSELPASQQIREQCLKQLKPGFLVLTSL